MITVGNPFPGCVTDACNVGHEARGTEHGVDSACAS